MKITQILKEKSSGISFEFFPPKTDSGKIKLEASIAILKECNPLYASMTYGAGGGTQARTKEAVNILLAKKDMEIMPHLTCVGAKKNEIKVLLDEYKSQGIENIMALRGDPPEGIPDFDFTTQDLSYGSDMVTFIKKEYGDNFCIGGAVYPEGHIESSSLEQDMRYTKKKVDAGVDFLVTQMFFNNDYFYALRDRMQKYSINVPVLPGILPLINLNKLKQFASICKATIPKEIEEAMEFYSGKPFEMGQVGIEYTIKQCRDLIKNGANKLHFFTLNKPATIKIILNSL
ncbi:MAG: methylenetetrahydrofolate reductase [NAD(P)H] [Candidatus Omnitrophica bacterium]|nr:methylenetetrahydrofolate reductase [NAD(P)H] [Candidatus Omnitrophota bacterium]